MAAEGERLTARVTGLPLANGTLRGGIAHFVVRNGDGATAWLEGGKLVIESKGPATVTDTPASMVGNVGSPFTLSDPDVKL